MTQPLTDAEILEYIERTPELKEFLINRWPSGWCHRALELMLPIPGSFARAFHANEQRVREEEREAVGLLRAVYQDLLTIREWNKGRIGLSAYPRAERLEEIAAFLSKQGGK